MALAMVVTILAIRPWAGAPDSQSKSTAPIAPRETIYRPHTGTCSEGSASGPAEPVRTNVGSV